MSTEGTTVLVEGLYRQLLRRPADAAGLTAFVALQTGAAVAETFDLECVAV